MRIKQWSGEIIHDRDCKGVTVPGERFTGETQGFEISFGKFGEELFEEPETLSLEEKRKIVADPPKTINPRKPSKNAHHTSAGEVPKSGETRVEK